MSDHGKRRGLTPAEWAEVRKRREAGESITSLSKAFTVRRNTISDRAVRESWCVQANGQNVQPSVQQNGGVTAQSLEQQQGAARKRRERMSGFNSDPTLATHNDEEAPGEPTRQTPTAPRDNTERHPGKKTPALTRSLQEQAFYLNVVEGRSCREIAQILNIDPTTASKYIRAETERRANELEDNRKSETARSVAFYDEMAALGVELARKSANAFMQPLIKGLDSAIKARERRDRILGVDAPTKLDLGLRGLLDALDVPDDDDGAKAPADGPDGSGDDGHTGAKA